MRPGDRRRLDHAPFFVKTWWNDLLKSRISFLGAGIIILLSAWSPAQVPAAGFHAGGSSSCATCHVMHASNDGMVVVVDSEPLLLAETASDLCLSCHDQDSVFGFDPLTPPPELGAGNFVFLLEDNLNDAPDGQTLIIPGEAAGHNITSMIMGTQPDSRWQESPGGNFPTSELGCTSCHDPHGNTNFRMLNGVGPVQGDVADFVNPAPLAVGLDITDPLATEANDQHTAYLAGMSEWCANCHGQFHQEDPSAPFTHPTDTALASEQMTIYNRYNGDDDPLGGSQATAYLKNVPFEHPGAAVNSSAGPSPGSRLMCLSCHRAHASSAPAAARWDMRVSKLEQDGVVSGSYSIPNPYPGDVQGALCRKCHPKGQNFKYDDQILNP